MAGRGTGRNGTAVAGIAFAVIASLTLLSACDDGDEGRGPGDFNQSFQRGRNESSVQVGDDAAIPADFPSAAVPLPDQGGLQAVVRGKVPPNRFYTLTYGLGGRSGVAAGADYRRQLERAGFDIRGYIAERGSDAGFATFDAISDQWDVFVVSGRGNRRERPALSIQVSTHGTLSGLSEPSGGILEPEDTTSTTTPETAP